MTLAFPSFTEFLRPVDFPPPAPALRIGMAILLSRCDMQPKPHYLSSCHTVYLHISALNMKSILYNDLPRFAFPCKYAYNVTPKASFNIWWGPPSTNTKKQYWRLTKIVKLFPEGGYTLRIVIYNFEAEACSFRWNICSFNAFQLIVEPQPIFY